MVWLFQLTLSTKLSYVGSVYDIRSGRAVGKLTSKAKPNLKTKNSCWHFKILINKIKYNLLKMIQNDTEAWSWRGTKKEHGGMELPSMSSQIQSLSSASWRDWFPLDFLLSQSNHLHRHQRWLHQYQLRLCKLLAHSNISMDCISSSIASTHSWWSAASVKLEIFLFFREL